MGMGGGVGGCARAGGGALLFKTPVLSATRLEVFCFRLMTA